MFNYLTTLAVETANKTEGVATLEVEETQTEAPASGLETFNEEVAVISGLFEEAQNSAKAAHAAAKAGEGNAKAALNSAKAEEEAISKGVAKITAAMRVAEDLGLDPSEVGKTLERGKSLLSEKEKEIATLKAGVKTAEEAEVATRVRLNRLLGVGDQPKATKPEAEAEDFGAMLQESFQEEDKARQRAEFDASLNEKAQVEAKAEAESLIVSLKEIAAAPRGIKSEEDANDAAHRLLKKHLLSRRLQTALWNATEDYRKAVNGKVAAVKAEKTAARETAEKRRVMHEGAGPMARRTGKTANKRAKEQALKSQVDLGEIAKETGLSVQLLESVRFGQKGGKR